MTKIDTSKIDYRYKWYVLAASGMGIFLGTIDGSIVNITLPVMEEYFHTTFSVIQWVVLVYLLTVSVLMLSIGRLADMVGKKPVYTAGFIIFAIGSLLCGLSPSVGSLIAARVLQGVGSSMVMALGMAITTEAFPPEERGRALGINGAIMSIGVVIGPTLGGLIVEHLSWHWIFFVNLPVGLIGIPMILRFVPDIRPAGGQKFDFAGAASLLVALLCLLLGLNLGQDHGFLDGMILALFGGFIVFLAVFIRIENHSTHAMIDLSLFGNVLLRANLITGFLTFVTQAGTGFLLPFYLQYCLQYDAQTAGLLMVTVPVCLGIVAPISGALSDRIGTRPMTALGLAFLLGGYVCASTLTLDASILGFILRFIPVGIGVGIFQSPNNSAVMGSAPKQQLGVVSSLLAITRTMGQTTGIAVLGAFWASRTFAYAGKFFPGGATEAPFGAQVSGLHDSFVLSIGLIGVSLAVAMMALVREKKMKRVEIVGAGE
jgi:EmrB/QacA subfamily drug resistance transporter